MAGLPHITREGLVQALTAAATLFIIIGNILKLTLEIVSKWEE